MLSKVQLVPVLSIKISGRKWENLKKFTFAWDSLIILVSKWYVNTTLNIQIKKFESSLACEAYLIQNYVWNQVYEPRILAIWIWKITSLSRKVLKDDSKNWNMAFTSFIPHFPGGGLHEIALHVRDYLLLLVFDTTLTYAASSSAQYNVINMIRVINSYCDLCNKIFMNKHAVDTQKKIIYGTRSVKKFCHYILTQSLVPKSTWFNFEMSL